MAFVASAGILPVTFSYMHAESVDPADEKITGTPESRRVIQRWIWEIRLMKPDNHLKKSVTSLLATDSHLKTSSPGISTFTSRR